MKNFVIAVMLFTSSINSSFGSHEIGGEITARNIGGLTYEITFNHYYDTTGIGAIVYEYLCINDSSGSWILTDNIALTPAVFSINGFQRLTYVDTVTFPAKGFYNIGYQDCCRYSAIANMGGGNTNIFIKSLLYADSTNSTPYFLTPGILFAQLNDTFSYNLLAFDADGDSLEFSIDTPLVNLFNSCWGLGIGHSNYTFPPSDPTLPFSINSQTGQITYLPTIQGYFQYRAIVKEYRNGVFLGSIERDMPILVGNFTGLNELTNKQDITKIYPNPSNGTITITSPATIDEIKISNLLGQVIYHTKPNQKNLELQIVRAGVYFVSLTTGTQTMTRKLVVQL